MHFFSYARQVILMQWIISLEPIKGGINYWRGGGGGGGTPLHLLYGDVSLDRV